MDINYILRQVSNTLVTYSEEHYTIHADAQGILVTGEYKGNPLHMYIQEVDKNYIDVRVSIKIRVSHMSVLIDRVVTEQTRVQPIQVEQAVSTLLQHVTVE
jgi:hypothetical protein